MNFMEKMKALELSNVQVSNINDAYLKLLNKSYDIKADLFAVCSDDDVIAVANKVKTGADVKEAFAEVIKLAKLDKEKEDALISVL